MHSVISAEVYAKLAFDALHITRNSRLFGFLKVARDLTSEDALYPALGKELLKRVKFVPRVLVHARTHSLAATSFHVLAEKLIRSKNTGN